MRIIATDLLKYLSGASKLLNVPIFCAISLSLSLSLLPPVFLSPSLSLGLLFASVTADVILNLVASSELD